MYLILGSAGKPLNRKVTLNSHQLGDVYDNRLNIYKFEDGKVWQLFAVANERNRWVADWRAVDTVED